MTSVLHTLRPVGGLSLQLHSDLNFTLFQPLADGSDRSLLGRFGMSFELRLPSGEPCRLVVGDLPPLPHPATVQTKFDSSLAELPTTRLTLDSGTVLVSERDASRQPPSGSSHSGSSQSSATSPALGAAGLDRGETLALRFRPEQGVQVSLLLRLTPQGLEIIPSILLDLRGGPDFVQLEAFVVNAPRLAGSFLDGLGDGPGWRFFPLAYNSFSPSYVRDSRAILGVPRFYTAGTFNQNTHSTYWGNFSDLHTSWMATLHHASGPETLLVGWLTSETGLGEVALRRRSPCQLEARLDLGRRHLLPGESLTGDGLRLAFGNDGEQLITTWTQEAADRMQARKPSLPVPTGWCSWYYYYTAITEAELDRNLDQLVQQRQTLPVSCIQLDDGFQTAVGDWLSLNKKFPSGLQAIAGRIKEAGFVPGLWTAPFMIQRSSEIFKRHKDWLIRDHDGRLKDFGYHPIWGVTSGQVYCLDATHPGVQAHLTHVYSTLKQLGFDYFKIDFLNAGLQSGRRYDRRKSPVEAFRLGLKLIREAVGESFVLGCGAPLMPCIGVVDAMRISSDVKEAWDDPVLGFISNGNGHPAAELAILNSMTRSHLHNVWWYNDPDCLVVRDQRSTLKEVEVRTLLTVLSLTGGMLLLSDDLTKLTPARRALAELALPVGGEAARTLGLQEEPRPRRYVRERRVPDGSPGGTHELLGAWINWGEGIEERKLSPTDFGLPEGHWHVYEFWSDHWQQLKPGERFPIVLDPHETGLYLFRQVQPHPQLITAALHIGQTTVVVAEETWDEATGCLTVRLALNAERQGRVWVSQPAGYGLHEILSEGGVKVQGSSTQPGAGRHRVRIEQAGVLRFYFKRSVSET